jgi:hypothetical protein
MYCNMKGARLIAPLFSFQQPLFNSWQTDSYLLV